MSLQPSSFFSQVMNLFDLNAYYGLKKTKKHWIHVVNETSHGLCWIFYEPVTSCGEWKKEGCYGVLPWSENMMLGCLVLIRLCEVTACERERVSERLI